MKKLVAEIESSGVSHVGPVREDNQDAIQLSDQQLPLERGWLYALADGMGGYAHGRMASTLALEKMFEAFYGERVMPIPQVLRRGVEQANLGVYKTAQHLNAGRMGTTLTAVGVVGNTLHLAHVGDSRAYLIRDRRAMCLTNDHTTVGDLVRMKVLPPDKVRTHAQRSILTKGIGLGLFVQPDIAQFALKEGDRIVLCSDGVWSVIEDHEFAKVASHAHDARDLSQRLIDLALERETDDNASAVTVHIHGFSHASVENDAPHKSWTLRDLFSRRQNPLLCVSDLVQN